MRLRPLCLLIVVVSQAFFASAAAPAIPRSLRVDVLGLLSPRRVDVRSSSPLSLSSGRAVPPGASVTIDLDRRRLRVRCPGQPVWRGNRVLAGRVGETVTVDVTGRNRRSRQLPAPVEFAMEHDRLVIRSDFPLDALVASAVSAEMDGAREPAALEAAAIAIRSYLVASVGRHARDGFDVCDSTHCVHSSGLVAEGTVAWASVQATSGKVLSREGRIVAGFINACCGGRTATPTVLWGSSDSGDYAPVACRWCRSSPYASWTRSLSVSSVATALKDSLGLSVRSDYGVRAVRDGDGWVTSVRIVSGSMERRMTGDVFRMTIGRRLGWDSLPSPNFSLERDRGVFVLRGAGFGHGIGLCLAGAIEQARAGVSGDAIVRAYFPRASIVSLPRASGGL